MCVSSTSITPCLKRNRHCYLTIEVKNYRNIFPNLSLCYKPNGRRVEVCSERGENILGWQLMEQAICEPKYPSSWRIIIRNLISWAPPVLPVVKCVSVNVSGVISRQHTLVQTLGGRQGRSGRVWKREVLRQPGGELRIVQPRTIVAVPSTLPLPLYSCMKVPWIQVEGSFVCRK